MGMFIVALVCAVALAAALHQHRHSNGKTHQWGLFTLRVNPDRRGPFRVPRNQTD